MEDRYATYAVISHLHGTSHDEEQRIAEYLVHAHPSLRRVDATEAELLLIFGGDGTLLETVRTSANRTAHILAFNCGRAGFLSTVREPSRFTETIDAAMRDGLEAMPVRRMTVTVTKGDTARVAHAVNEAFLECTMTWLTMTVDSVRDGASTRVKNVRGPGLCVASAIGSTSPLAASLGAPPIDPSLAAFYVRGLIDSTKPSTGMLLTGGGASVRVTLAAIEPNPGIPAAHRRAPTLFVDGLFVTDLSVGDIIDIAYDREVMTLLRLPDDTHWQRLP